MARYIIRRSIQSVFLLWAATLISFTVYQLAPGGPVQFLEEDPKATGEDARLTRLYGLDRPLSTVNISPGWPVKIGCPKTSPGAAVAA